MLKDVEVWRENLSKGCNNPCLNLSNVFLFTPPDEEHHSDGGRLEQEGAGRESPSLRGGMGRSYSAEEEMEEDREWLFPFPW